LVNWCCELQSTISDMEVSHVAVNKRTHFQLPGFRYITFLYVFLLQCCGSGNFYPGSGSDQFLVSEGLLSREWIPEPDPTNKRREK
jgi:hypothetical protein